MVLGGLGVLFSALSLIGLIQHITDVGLIGAFEALVVWWQSWTHPIVEFVVGWIPNLFGFTLPDWGKDVFIACYVPTVWWVRGMAEAAKIEAVGLPRSWYDVVIVAFIEFALALALTVSVVGVAFALRAIILGAHVWLSPSLRARVRGLVEISRDADLAQLTREQVKAIRQAVNTEHRIYAFQWALGSIAAVCVFYALNAFA